MTKQEYKYKVKEMLNMCLDPTSDCRDKCDYCDYNCCQDYLCRDALAIINEQEKEIELLKMQLQDVVNHADTFLAEEQKFEAENVKLKAENEDLKYEIIYLERKIVIRDNALKDSDKAIEMLEGKQDAIVKQAQIDVLNELKSKAWQGYQVGMYVVSTQEIDVLIKEVENEQKIQNHRGNWRDL